MVVMAYMLAWIPFLTGLQAQSPAAGLDYEYYRTGNPDDVVTETTPGWVLMGGGRDVTSAF